MTTDPKLDSQTQAAAKATVRYSLAYVFYAITLLASALATFGKWGIVPAAVLLAAWGIVFASRSRPRTLLIVAACLLLLGGCLLPAMQSARESSRRGSCENNLRQVALALRAYHNEHGTFPPAVIYDTSGKPMHSWRVLILPYLEEQKLYDAYNFQEPWNGPNNSKLAASIPLHYRCPSHPTAPGQPVGATSYFAVTGERTAWSQTIEAKGTESTVGNDSLLLVESHQQNVNWLEPRDLRAEETRALLTGKVSDDRGTHRFDDLRDGAETHGRFAVIANGTATVLIEGLTEETAIALLDANGTSAVRTGYLAHMQQLRGREISPTFWFRFSGFVLVALLPLPWVWLNPTGSGRHRFISLRVSSRKA